MTTSRTLIALAAASLCAGAFAAPITYTFSGQASILGNDGSPGVQSYSLVVQADTAQIQDQGGGLLLVEPASHQFSLGGGPATTITNAGLYVAIDQTVGLAFGFDTGDWLIVGLGGGLATYGLDTDFGPYTVGAPVYDQTITLSLASGADWVITGLRDVTFTADLQTVPEPGSYALAGLALAGLALTRRRRA